MPLGASLLFGQFYSRDTHWNPENGLQKPSLRAAYKIKYMSSHLEREMDSYFPSVDALLSVDD